MASSYCPSQPPRVSPIASCKVMAVDSFRFNPEPVPLALEAVHAGFPSVAQDYFNGDFSFDENVIIHPNSTFIIRVAGESMTGAGIFDGDLLVVDRSLEPRSDDIVIAILDDEMLVKRLVMHKGRAILHAENPDYPDFMPQDGEELVIWGVVIGNYHWQRVDPPSGLVSHSPPGVTYPGHQKSANHQPQPSRPNHPAGGSHFQSPYPSAEWGHHD